MGLGHRKIVKVNVTLTRTSGAALTRALTSLIIFSLGKLAVDAKRRLDLLWSLVWTRT